MSKTFVANVKSVLSGDTLVLTSPNNPNLERTFSLAFVSAPRLSKDGDEAFAFQSREFLREAAIGKLVQCKVLYTIPSSGREYGTAIVKAGPELPDALVQAGWVKVREDAGKKEEDEETLQRLEALRALESQARTESDGLWVGSGGHIEVQNDLGGPDFMKEWKGKTVDGVIERVFSGDRILVRLLLSEKKHCQVMTLLAGIRTPATERTGPNGVTQAAEEHGDEAKAFVEARLLQRKIKIDMVGASPQGSLVASLIHPRGNIAEFLLAEGLARCNDFHSTMLGERMAALRAAEKKAQAAKLRLHKHHVAKAAEAGSQDVTVAKIIGADAIIVRNKNGDERRINISSVRGPRAAESNEAPFRDEAKEYLRKRVIGKHVQLTIDGSRPAEGDFEARDVATVVQGGKNVGLQLVQEGYASVIRHRKDDTDRAPNYDELLVAQETAKTEGKGMWSGKAPKVKQYTDASESVQRARIQLSVLQRQKKVPAIVDFCKSGSRFTILIPREGVKLTLVLGGIRAPRAPGRNPAQDKGEPFGLEALELANKRCNQRDCEVDIHDMDKVGGFIGDLYINRESFAKTLVEEGLASVHQYSAEKSGNAAELNAAEKRAKEAKKGMWHDWEPSQEEEYDGGVAEATSALESATIDKKPEDYRDIVITNIEPNGKLKIQEVGKGTAALETMMNEFKRFHNDPKNNTGGKENPKTGELVAAKFSADGQWYRARVRSNDRAAKVAEVVYIDYGNSEKQPWAKLRALDQPQFSVQKLKAQAADAMLSFVELPVNSPDYALDAVDFIARATEGKRLVGSFDFVDSKENVSYITIFDPEAGKGKLPGVADSVNRDVVLNGHAMVPRKLRGWERSKVFESTLKSLREAETQAKQDRLGMWEYGDLTED
ncbi:nuclease domain-containing protein 1 [Gaeumannomyces tritici R3-111a-1]|uniref:Probable endonuclease LCL3 n=1 Tax=Gaeumannomyces tritici (strain R3-111a-1) TaxID=644352 RepID=J3PD34_GAET3|nr:nuclease domain-containing protein 1 [Gaeumannomyces tritici R3-111a-1]EJT70379.1 nuclease domain-containing protein 1 [Gaeumannomyces tritici R3-111a-1]